MAGSLYAILRHPYGMSDSAGPFDSASPTLDPNAPAAAPDGLRPPAAAVPYSGAPTEPFGSAPVSGAPGYGSYPGAGTPPVYPGVPPGYVPPPGYNLPAGYPATPKTGMSTPVKVLIGVLVGVFLLGGLSLALFAWLTPGTPKVTVANPTPASTPNGLSELNGRKHFRNTSLGLDLDVPADWTPQTEANTLVYLVSPSGCNLIVMDNPLFAVTPDAYNSALKDQLIKGMPGVVFGTRPPWTGPQPPTYSLEASSQGSVVQYYTHFFRTGHVLSTIETLRASDTTCPAQFNAIEQSFRLK